MNLNIVAKIILQGNKKLLNFNFIDILCLFLINLYYVKKLRFYG